MTRISLLPEFQVNNTIAELATAQRDLKAYQRAGSDTVLMQRIFSGDAADVTFTTVGFDDKAFYLVFTPDDTTFNTSIVYKMEFTFTEGTGNSVDFLVERQKVEAGNVQKWLVALNGSDFFPNSEVTMKFYFWASGPGTFTTEVL